MYCRFRLRPVSSFGYVGQVAAKSDSPRMEGMSANLACSGFGEDDKTTLKARPTTTDSTVPSKGPTTGHTELRPR
jgi:hypothetical protein